MLTRTASIVFEGLDAAGKTTQADLLQNRIVPGGAEFVHMPTGFTPFTVRLRSLLEDPSARPRSGLAQQLAHLACHADAMPTLAELATRGPVVLDRWWWSTLVYGWDSGAISEDQITRTQFRSLVETIWRPFTASLVLVFLHSYEDDPNNSSAIAEGYRRLLEADPNAVEVPGGATGDVSDWIADVILDRGLGSRSPA